MYYYYYYYIIRYLLLEVDAVVNIRKYNTILIVYILNKRPRSRHDGWDCNNQERRILALPGPNSTTTITVVLELGL